MPGLHRIRFAGVCFISPAESFASLQIIRGSPKQWKGPSGNSVVVNRFPSVRSRAKNRARKLSRSAWTLGCLDSSEVMLGLRWAGAAGSLLGPFAPGTLVGSRVRLCAGGVRVAEAKWAGRKLGRGRGELLHLETTKKNL